MIKKILNKCVACRKLNLHPYNYPVSPDLPSIRLNDDASFSGIGIDYSEALYCKNLFNSNSIHEDDMYKCYIVIYTCASMRGVVLDLVPDASAETLNSLSKFISRRACSQIILSDNGSPFIADITQNFLASKNVKWDFNLARKLNLENVHSDFNLKNEVELKKYVNHTNNLLTHFWNRSRSEYVPTPREYQKV